MRQFRKKLLWKLKYDHRLTHKDRASLNGLEALGLVTEGHLTKWGQYFIKGEGNLPSPKAGKPCQLQRNQFIASIPEHADLLWEIERHLRPQSPGVYPLTRRALQFCGGDPHELVELLERGLGGPMDGRMKALILGQPSIRINEGIVLEFSSPAELKQLRRQPVFRKYLDGFLSPQRVLVSREKAQGLLRMLTRRGIYMSWNEEQVETRPKRTHFASQPKIMPGPVGKSVSKLVLLEKYKQLGQALDVLYRTPGHPAEHRRITPLLIEQRGEHVYVVAHCQTRRAQRTFRLDRIEVPGTY